MKKLKTTDKVIKPTSEKKLVKSLNEDVRVGKPAVKRSPRWDNVRNEHLKNNPVCVACGKTERLQVQQQQHLQQVRKNTRSSPICRHQQT